MQTASTAVLGPGSFLELLMIGNEMISGQGFAMKLYTF